MVRTKRMPGVPGYLRHKRSGQAFTVVRGEGGRRRQVPLGPYGSPESRRRYREVLAAYLRDELPPGSSGPSEPEPVTIEELVARFLKWAEGYYPSPAVRGKGEFAEYIYAARPLLDLYGDLTVAELGPLRLKQVREVMIESGLCRGVINQRVGRLKRIFKWGVENELVSPTVFQALQAVRGLARGRTVARETEPVRPVRWSDVSAVLPHVSQQVRALILLQWHSGCRPGEAVQMRTCDLDMDEDIWIYRPASHKTQHQGREREVCLGPKAQAAVRPFLRADPNAYLFQPAEAERERLKRMRLLRKTHVQPSQQNRQKPDPKKRPGQSYTVDSYRRAINAGCERAKVPAWSPNQLRHSRGTEVRKQYGLEGSQVVLGHSRADVTQVYAERDRALALRIASEIG